MVRKGKITDWSTFASEVRLIWENAKEYNEPGSEIYEMAEVLEVSLTFCGTDRLTNGPDIHRE